MTSNLRSSLEKLLRGRGDLTEKKMLFLGWLNKQMPRGEKAILVGGSLVQFYSGGAYESVDIDLVARRREEISAILNDAGFKEDVRGFEDLELGIVVDVSTKGLRPTENVETVRFEGLEVPVVSLEDSITDRLLAAKFWRSNQDWEQALLLYRVNASKVDQAKLDAKAKANDVDDFAKRLRSPA